MSFNRLEYDTCAYEQELNQSTGTGRYVLNVPSVSNCEPCYASDPRYGQVQQGSSTVGKSIYKNVDVESDLLGQTRLASRCQTQNFMPSCEAPELSHYKDCPLVSEETRTTNPPCNLRGTGWNRWEWLCKNPQDRVAIPFDYQVSTRIVFKDNHRPCIPNPFDQYSAWPQPTDQPICENIVRTCGVPTDPPSVQWRSAEEIKNY